MTKTRCKPAAEYRTDAPREDGWTFERQAAFLMAIAETGLVSTACKVAGMNPASAYALRNEARGTAFNLGWQAAHLLARDRLEDVLLEAAISGIESVTTRIETTTHRHVLNGNLSIAVLNRLDRRAASLDDRAAAAARAVGAAFEAFIALVLKGGGNEAIAAFLAEHPDPLAPMSKDKAPAKNVQVPQLIEKSAIFVRAAISKMPALVPFTGQVITVRPARLHFTPEPALREAA